MVAIEFGMWRSGRTGNEPKDLLALDHARRIPQFRKILTNEII
jgi:hypothetical protein